MYSHNITNQLILEKIPEERNLILKIILIQNILPIEADKLFKSIINFVKINFKMFLTFLFIYVKGSYVKTTFVSEPIN
jgi:hypothetical protein